MTRHIRQIYTQKIIILNDPLDPGETIALIEVYGLNNIRLKRYPYTSRVSYFVNE
jgi:hypothetical protein